MTETVFPGDRLLDELAAPAFALHRELCAREGVDAEVELVEARLVHGESAAAWVARRLLADLVGRQGADAGGVREVPGLLRSVTTTGASLPACAWALLIAAGQADDLMWRPGAPVEVVHALAVHPDPGLRAWAAGRSETGLEWVRRLAADPERTVRRRIAGRSGLPADVFTLLDRDGDLEVRGALHDRHPQPRTNVA